MLARVFEFRYYVGSIYPKHLYRVSWTSLRHWPKDGVWIGSEVRNGWQL